MRRLTLVGVTLTLMVVVYIALPQAQAVIQSSVSRLTQLIIADRTVISSTAPTISSGFGTTPAIIASAGTAAFTVNVGTGGTASEGVIALPAATTGWNCFVENRTGVAANRASQRTVQTATTTATATVQNQSLTTGGALAWAASDVLAVACFGY